jgi:type I restriction enzyme M protein
MLTSQVKTRINTCRDILVGKLPDPKSQVLQITNALIYKFMDDQDRTAEKLGGKPSFFKGELKDYAWHKLFDSKLSNQEKADKYIEGIEKLSQAKHLPELFREIFKEAYVPFRAAGTIVLFIDEINKFDYHHSEELGNAYEYLLSIMGSQGDAGQFRTPRHIIEFLVDVVDPQKGETIYDPAAGTAGFLIAAYKHIVEENKKLSPTDNKNLSKNISGIDIDPGMAKMARVNLYLHGFTTPHIDEGDTLSDENLWGKKFDVILANPPFMSPKGGIQPHKKFNVKAKRSEVLFVDYIAEHLKLKGRAGIIVPEGIIFQSGTVYKELRKMLIEDNYLHAVISLPAGVFQPYSGVKTSMLILDRERAKETDEILFLKIENDGFTIGAQRTPKDGSEIPQALEVVKKWRGGKKSEASFASWVSKKEIVDSGDFNLSGERYRVFEQAETEWEIVKLEEVADFMTGGTPRSSESKYYDNGNVRWIVSGDIHKGNIYDCKGRITELGVAESNAKLLPKNSVLIALNGQGKTRGTVALLRTEATCNQSIVSINPKENLVPEYLYYVLKSQYKNIRALTGDGQRSGLNIPIIKKIKIPLPPLEIQKEIVTELDRYQKIIDGARQVVENYKPSYRINPDWQVTNFGDVCEFVRGPFGGSLKKDIFVSDGYAVYEQSHAISDNFNKVRYFIDEKKFEEMKRFELCTGDLIMSCSGTMGKTAIVPKGIKKGIINQALLKLSTKKELDVVFMKVWMDSPSFQNQLLSNVGGAAIQNVASVKVLQSLKIQLPPLDEQKIIVSRIEEEKNKVNSCKELISEFEQKIQDKIAEVWGE